MDDPESLTPEERFVQAMNAYKILRSPSDDLVAHNFTEVFRMVIALRDMIASLDAEMARLTETVNGITRDAGAQFHANANSIVGLELRIAALESPSGDGWT